MRRVSQRYVDAIIQGFLKASDHATLTLAPPLLDQKDRVMVVANNNKTLRVEIEDAGCGIGSIPTNRESRLQPTEKDHRRSLYNDLKSRILLHLWLYFCLLAFSNMGNTNSLTENSYARQRNALVEK